MKKLPILIILILVILIIDACKTTTSVRMLKPAELDVGAVKKIAVLDFDFTGSWDLEETSAKNLEELGIKILEKAITKEKPPDPRSAYPGKNITDMLIAKLVNNRYYTVIEREQIAKILEEQAFSLSGVIDENQAAQIGKLVGAEGLVMGSGTYSIKDKGEWETYKEKKEEKKRFRISRMVDARITFKIVDVTRGTIIISQTNSASNARGNKVAAKYSSTGRNEREALKGVPDWRPIVDDLVSQILNHTIRQIAPHYVDERRIIEEGESPAMEAAVEYAKRGLWEDAKGLWETVMEDPVADKEDRIAATYNMGLYYEVNGQLDEAENMFDSSFKLSGDTKYLDAKVRIQNRRNELERLKRQQM